MKFLPLALLCILSCGCAGMSDPGTIYRETASQINADELPKLVLNTISENRSEPAIIRVQKWGESPYQWFEVEFENNESENYNPDGSNRLRTHGGIL